MEDNLQRKLPPRSWLAIAAALLTLWAIALAAWWSRLQQPQPAAPSAPAPQAAVQAWATPTPAPTQVPTPAGTPATTAVVRAPGKLVQQQDWLALAQAFNLDRAMADIAELTSPKYAGRAVGSPGGKLSGDWLAERFAEYGLQPAGDDGSFFQSFPVPFAELSDMPHFALFDAAGQTEKVYTFREDYTIWLGGYADGGVAQGRVIWVSDGRHDDYDNLDASDSIVLCRYRYPFDDIQRQALEHGAKAVILAAQGDANFRMRRTARQNALLPQGIPTLLVTEQVIEDLLAGSGLSLDDLTVQYTAQTLSTQVDIRVPLYYEQGATGRNVLGVLPGSDPDGVQQVFVIGGHYDHMGADPDGTAWVGANDNASGVAVLLEIARLWQEQGYVPKRTVLFAAWDGEEIGLFGSQYYVEHPRYPLEDTVGMLQLDMVGAGTEQLAIDAGGLVADQSLASAGSLDLSIRPQSLGRSDHAPFVGAGVPATLYIWWDGDAPGIVYHVPEDDITNIEPDKLYRVGVLANLVTLSLSWDHEALEDRSAQRMEAIATRDASALLQTVDPLDEMLLSEQESWLNALVARQPAYFTTTFGSALVAGEIATSTMTVRYQWPENDRPLSATVPVNWVRRDGDWFYSGPAWDTEHGEHVQLRHLQPPQVHSLVERADDAYAFLVEELGLDLPETVPIAFYSKPGHAASVSLPSAGNDALLHALVVPPHGYESAQGWASLDGIVLSDSDRLETTLAELALQHGGWPGSTASWLAQGLIDSWQAQQTDSLAELEEQYLPLLAAADLDQELWIQNDLPDRHQIGDQSMALWSAQAWALTTYLLQELGPTAIGQPAVLALDGWRAHILDPWQAAAQGIEETLAQRSAAVLDRDHDAFLASVDPANRVLYREEVHWFEDLALHPASSYDCQGSLVSLSDTLAVAELSVRYALAETPSTAPLLRYRARFTQQGGRWLYSGVDFGEQRSEHFVLKFEHPEHGSHAQHLLELAERAYTQVTSDLAFAPAEAMEIKVYHQPDLFRYSIYMSMFPARGWTEPGESIKLALPASESMSLEGVGAVLAHELTHSALFAKGVRHGAVHEGTAQYQAGVYNPQWLAENVRSWRREVYDLVRSKRALTLRDLENWREVDPADLGLMYTLGWDTVTFFRKQFGRTTFLEWLDLLGGDLSFDQAFRQAASMPFDEFDALWRESVLRGHIDAGYIDVALKADGQRALSHVKVLADPALQGRQAGTEGNQTAAQYVAEQFARLGLSPAGDEGSYFQWFKAPQSTLTAPPVLRLRTDGGDEETLTHGLDFRTLLGAQAGGGTVDAPLLYVRDLANSALSLGGRVALVQAGDDIWRQAREASVRGAGALLVLTDKWSGEMTTRSNDQPLPSSTSIPVLELSSEAGQTLLDLAGYRPWELDEAPPALAMPLAAHISVQIAITPSVTVPNVLGVLPGGDPELDDEVIVIGAHLDHVGSLPDGTIYPGANNDASGVAALLEIARIWHEEGYRPRRTVLFAVWNANEVGRLGSQHYARHPVQPLSSTVGVIQLDMVGQGKGYYAIASGSAERDAALLGALENAAPQVQGRLSIEHLATPSDHAPFAERGVPAVLLSWEEPQYTNEPADTPELIDVLKLQSVSRLTALAVMTMADD